MDNGNNLDNELQQELQNEIQRLLQEFNRTRLHNRNRNNSRNRRSNDNADIIIFLRELLYLYNNNFRDYQENVRLLINTISGLINNNSNYDAPNPFRNMYNDFFYYTLPSVNRLNRQTNAFNENVIVRPTNEHISSATISYEYSTETPENFTSCPITMDEFRDGDQVCKIHHCGHTFRRDAIMNWFQTNVRCPVCRYDIREYTTQNGEDSSTNQTILNQELQNNIRNRISNSLMQIIDEYYPNIMDSSQNFIYAFDIPIVYNDNSGNNVR
jgi:hypothetical protein